jgi:glycosyltransferase involved in cell wall biosynthesis
VAEALACCVPVLLTNKVNIWKDIEDEKAGFVAEDTLEGLRESFHKWTALDSIARNKMKENAKRCFDQHFEINANSRKLIVSIQLELAKLKE